MGGISVLVMLTAMGALMLAIVSALAMFIAATVTTIVFAVRTKRRHAQGKKLKGLIAIPIVLYAISIPVLALFSVGVLAPAYHASVTATYDDCATAVTTHKPDQLERCLDAPDLQLPDEGPQSFRSLLHVAIVYGDQDCARTLLCAAKDDGRPIDLSEPLASYDKDGNPSDADCALCLATSSSFSSLDMVQTLIDFGADVNGADGTGKTPLHNACDDRCTTAIASDTSSASLAETDAAIDLLLGAGANVDARDQNGETPWDCYRATLDAYVRDGVLTEQEAAAHLAERAEALRPSA